METKINKVKNSLMDAKLSKPKMRTVYPDVKLSFNEISMHIRNEIMKSYQQSKK